MKKVKIKAFCGLTLIFLSSFSVSYTQELCSSGLEDTMGTQIFMEILLEADREGLLSTSQIKALLESTAPFNPILEETVASAALSKQFKNWPLLLV